MTKVRHIDHYRADIDGLRAVAVLAVVSFHFFKGVVPGGFVGVDIFFVISGFLISRILFQALETNHFDAVDFYSRRIARIFPALSIVLLFTLVAGWLLLLPDEYAQLGKHVLAGTAFVSNLVLWHEAGYFDQASASKPLLHLWSLGIEEQFYIFYPLILPFIWRLRKIAGWLLLLITVTSFSFNVYFVSIDSSAAFYSPITRFWELSTGGLIAIYQSSHRQVGSPQYRMVHSTMSVIGLAMILVTILLLSSQKTFPGWWAMLPVCGTAALLCAGPHAFVNKYVLSNAVLVWIGLVSYPLYLWHWPLLTFAQADASEPLSRSVRIALVIISLLLAWLTYQYIETPVRKGFTQKPVFKIIRNRLLLVMVVTGGLGFSVYLRDGLPSRLPPIIQQLSEIDFDHTIRTRVGTCFLLNGQTTMQYSKCEDNLDADRPSVLLIGDSHASHLYPGLQKRFDEKLNIIQRTAGGCPPMFGPLTDAITSLCKDVNQYNRRLIVQLKPKIVILSANWLFYDLTELKETVQYLRSAAIENIVLVGPVPQWRESLVKQIYRSYRNTGYPQVPLKMSLGLNPLLSEVDGQIANLAASMRVQYISPRRLLCDTEGCLIRYGESIDTLMTWDYGHLTNEASEYLVSKFPDIASPQLQP